MKRTFFAITVIAIMTFFGACTEKENNKPTDNNDTQEPEKIQAETPRNIVKGSDGKFYVTCYYPRCVARFDIATKRIEAICKLGNYQPEGLAEVNGKLYIASGYITDENNEYHYDKKLYVVDMSNFTLVDSITVNLNPDRVKKLDDNHIVFSTLGDYNTTPMGLWVMDVTSKNITQMDVALYNFDVYNGDIYGYTNLYSGDPLEFYKIDGQSHQATSLGINWTASDNPYGIGVNPLNGDIIVTSDGGYTAQGDCYVFNNDGSVSTNAIQVGFLPCKIIAIDGDNILVLNQGSWGANNAGVSKVNLANNTAVNDFFDKANGRGLGDVGQDMIVDGDKAYITVSFSNSIEIMDVANGKSTRYATDK